MELEEGQMITFAEGEYSDYMVNGLVRVIKPFNIKEAQSRWEADHTEFKINQFNARKQRKITGMVFLAWLVKSGLVCDVDYIEIHTGSYGESEIDYESYHAKK